MQLSSFHKQLKEETSSYHDELEKEVLPKKIFNLEISKEEYKSYLKLFFQIHKEIEDELSKFEDWEKLDFDLKSYFREKLILKDLEIINTQIDSKKDSELKIESFPEALGFLYVLTGSTMGGIVLSKKIEERFKNSTYENANNYFSAFKEKNHPMFFALMKFIEDYSKDSLTHQKEIIKGAINCYLLVKKGLVSLS